MARVYQRDKDRAGNISAKARDAFWVEIDDCDGVPIREKIGDRGLAQRVLNKLRVERDEGRLYKSNRDRTIADLIDGYLAAKPNVANPEALKAQMAFLRRQFGGLKAHELTSPRFELTRRKWSEASKKVK